MSSLAMALITALWYWIAGSLCGYTLFSTLKSPIFIGFVLGLLSGNMATGLMAGAAIEVIYLGLIAPGGNIPSDKCLAALIAVPIVLQTGMSIEVAVTLAVPVGIFGVLVNNLRRTGNAFFIHKADAYAEELNMRGIWHAATTYCFIFGFILRFPLVFLANLYGPELVQGFLNVIPESILHGLTVMGGMLPAIGFATSIFMIGKKSLLPYFFIGFFIVEYFQLPIMAAAIFGTCLAALLTLTNKPKEEVESEVF